MNGEQPGSKTASSCVSPSTYLGLSANVSPRGTPKTVSIAKEPEFISPLILGGRKPIDDLDIGPCRLPRKAPVATKRLSGRLSCTDSPTIRPGSSSNTHAESDDRDFPTLANLAAHRHIDQLVEQVYAWIKAEREKRGNRKQRRALHKKHKHAPSNGSVHPDHPEIPVKDFHHEDEKKRRDSDASDASFDLDKLDEILRVAHLSTDRHPSRKSSINFRYKSSPRMTRKQSAISSDTDAVDIDPVVPSCDVVLDNSNTLSYAGGASEESEGFSGDELTRTASYRDQDSWASFKFEIVRLTHTLRLKGWRRVPMDRSNSITVQRLSGALTNAVYVVSPPADLPVRTKYHEGDNGGVQVTKKPPPPLLLRIYGPQVEHLIDRKSELAILCRLSKKKIGPRLLGTFANGRFEEYLHAKTLTADEVKQPETSRQIAKRMRELHDGIELLHDEREAGPFVWRNWDKWLFRVEQIVTWMDQEVQKLPPGFKPTGDEAWKRRGFIVGVPWSQFRATVEKHRSWLVAKYGGSQNLIKELVFAHNDTQYGNILRLIPTGDSPLLLPSNTHKQLVVIDFEYANANTVGLEFANHFTEWCYNYHDAKKPYAFHANRYPTVEEQDRFLRAYVRHRPQFNVSTPKLAPSSNSTPTITPSSSRPELSTRRPTSNIGDFMLDARAPSTAPSSVPPPSSTSTQQDEKYSEDNEVSQLMESTRWWRMANSALWISWGIVQAKIPGMPDFKFDDEPNGSEETKDNATDSQSKTQAMQAADDAAIHAAYPCDAAAAEKEEEAVEEEFDYLGYSQHRALSFWADAVDMGFVEKGDLPEDLFAKLKFVSR